MGEAAWAVEKVYKEREAARQAGRTFEGRYLVPTISCVYSTFSAALKRAFMYSLIVMNLRRFIVCCVGVAANLYSKFKVHYRSDGWTLGRRSLCSFMMLLNCTRMAPVCHNSSS